MVCWLLDRGRVAGGRRARLVREIPAGRIKVARRSVGDVDVAAFAKPFGGGGHTKASGLSMEGSMGEVQGRVLEAARMFLGGNGKR